MTSFLVVVRILASACLIALLLTRHGPGTQPRAEVSSPRPARGATGYDLAQLPILTKALFQVNESYFDKTRFDPRRMLVGALDFVQREVPEILVDRLPELEPRQVRLRVGGHEQIFDLEPIDSPWRLRSTLQQMFRFVQPRLNPGPAEEQGQRLLAIEVAATNGVLYTLDPHSTLLDVDSYREMRTQTQGRFGGVGMALLEHRTRGIVVSKLIPGTPAVRAGIRPRDRIVRIDNESTVSMTVSEAVNRLRGEVGAKVEVYIERRGVDAPLKLSIVRDTIRPSSIDREQVLTSRAEPGTTPGSGATKIGYFRIDHFSSSTESDLMATLDRFEREKVKGLIMDLRDNPGGLYDQASKVADAFIHSGTLVSMVGVGGSHRRDEVASPGGNLKLPLAVLVDARSASASEIVAGAIKNLDRGVVIGDTTFGKGSVQMLFDIPSPVPGARRPSEEPRLGLKLTTAQYLTPGDASIQGVGVAPDIELIPMLVQKGKSETIIRLQKSAHRRQESDLEWSLTQAGAKGDARKGVPLAETISYLHVPPPRQDRLAHQDEAREEEPAASAAQAGDNDAEDADDADAENQVDFAMELARDLLAQARWSDRRRMLASSSGFFRRVRDEQDESVKQALEKVGVDWGAPEARKTAAGENLAVLHASLALVGNAGHVLAGETARIRGTVRNTSAFAAHRVRLVCKSANLLLDENEMVLGRIGPHETRSYDLAVKIPRSSLTRTDSIRALVFAETPIKANTPEVTLDIQGKPRPLFAYSYQTVDVDGNRDGQVQRGEKVRLLVTIKNIGAGTALRTEAVLRNRPGQPGILITAGQFHGEELAPQASRDLSFAYQVGKDFLADEYQLELRVADSVLGESVSDRIKIAVAQSEQIVEPQGGMVRLLHDGTALREAPHEGGMVVAHSDTGAVFKATGKFGGFTRIELGPGRDAFVAAADVGAGAAARPIFQPVWQVTPPVLTVRALTVTTGSTVRVTGTAVDEQQVRDLYIRVYNRDSKMPPRKTFYLLNQGSPTTLEFEREVPVQPGSNIIQVFARETDQVQAVATLVVLQKQSPRLVQAR
jgi:carboxyl-terminal processing protease